MIFPNSQIFMSSIIIPTEGRRLKENTLESNQTLKSQCIKDKITYIDNNFTFYTKQGQPKKHLFNDSIHPSHIGTVKLACLIKYTIRNTFLPSKYHHHPGLLPHPTHHPGLLPHPIHQRRRPLPPPYYRSTGENWTSTFYAQHGLLPLPIQKSSHPPKITLSKSNSRNWTSTFHRIPYYHKTTFLETLV